MSKKKKETEKYETEDRNFTAHEIPALHSSLEDVKHQIITNYNLNKHQIASVEGKINYRGNE